MGHFTAGELKGNGRKGEERKENGRKR